MYVGNMDKQTLETVADWAEERVNSGQEPPWTFQSLKTLISLTRELAAGMEANVKTVNEQGLELPQDDSPTLKADIIQLDSFRPRPSETDSLQLPT